jgi:hypothetical protein
MAIVLDGTTGITSPSLSSLTTISAGDWSITATGTNLIFSYNGTDLGKLTSAGDFVVIGDVTAFGVI